MLIKYGDKFYPVKKDAVDLSEVTESNKKQFLTKDRFWYLYISGLYRDYVETFTSSSKFEDLSQEFVAIITIRDSTETTNVYNDVSQKLVENNFINYNLNIDLENKVQLNN